MNEWNQFYIKFNKHPATDPNQLEIFIYILLENISLVSYYKLHFDAMHLQNHLANEFQFEHFEPV